MIEAEQGLGDSIQFARHFAELKARGARVIFHVPPPLAQLARCLDFCDVVVVEGAIDGRPDYYCHLLGLPKVLGTSIGTIPAPIPYLRVPDRNKSRWNARLPSGARRRVGVAWAGSPSHSRDRERSIPAALLTPLLQIDDVEFVSLQKGDPAKDLVRYDLADRVIELGPELDDLVDAAAVIEGLDLVICVDTALAHLAGALGKPTWVLLPRPADWRWLTGREDTPWYPTMRLFRQTERGEWRTVVEKVAQALRDGTRDDRTSREGRELSEAAVLDEPTDEAFGAVAEIRGGIVQYRPDDLPAGRAIGRYGEYLQDVLDIVLPQMSLGSIVLEIGAGVGLHTLGFCAAVGARGRVIAWECRPLERSILETNLKVNGHANATILRTQHESDMLPALDHARLERLDWLIIGETEPARDVLAGCEQLLWGARPRIVIRATTPEAIAQAAELLYLASYRCWTRDVAVATDQNFYGRHLDAGDGGAISVLTASPEERESLRVPGNWTNLVAASH